MNEEEILKNITNTQRKKLLQSQKREDEITKASALYKKNPAIFLALKEFRKKDYKSLREAIKSIRNIDLRASVSITNLATWKKQFNTLIKNNNLFRDFMIKIWIDPDEVKTDNQRLMEIRHKIKKHKKRKEKDDKLKEEMNKANIILEEISNPNITESEKWRLSERWRRQVDSINSAVAEWGLPKVDGVIELYNINAKLLATWKEIILKNLNSLKVKQYWDLKVISDILDTSFKQNRLIDWKSTDNIAIGVHDIYDKIIDNANQKRENGNIWNTEPKT